MTRFRRLAALFALVTVAAIWISCGGSDSEDERWPKVITIGNDQPVIGDIHANELRVGHNQFVFSLFDNKALEAIAGAEVTVRFFNLDESTGEPVAQTTAEPIHVEGAVPPYDDVYRAHAQFSKAGNWGAELEFQPDDGKRQVVRLRFNVLEAAQTGGQGLLVGEAVPRTQNLTLDDVGGNLDDQRLTTDPEPDPAMYEATIAESIEQGRPIVAVFATPGLCQTRLCGPMLNAAKKVRPEFADTVNFIHVEIGDLEATNKQGYLVYKPVFTEEWKHRTEPWTYVAGSDGRVFAKFEGVLVADDLRETLNRMLRESAGVR